MQIPKRKIRNLAQRLVAISPLVVTAYAMQLFFPPCLILRIMPNLLKYCGGLTALAIALCLEDEDGDLYASDSTTPEERGE